MDARPGSGSAFARRRSVKFGRLRLDGFKSFPDRTELPIEPGLTGVVGPNGCGKSNLLEAMRWAMGETSARNMRGASMDDVIFGGSERRPPRNVAEVVIELDNAARAAPAQMNDVDVLEISRRIERGQGVRYRINGKQALQKEVHLLFQDNAAGARSPAIVSQGKVAALISQKPAERRLVLEEAAGVSGINVRRRETATKLRGIEENLARADEALLAANDILAGLRRQARQVQRRREIDALVRAAQSLVMHLRHREALEGEDRAAAAHEENEARIERALLDVAQASRAREESVAALGPVRDARLRAEGAMARAQARLEGAAAEVERVQKALVEARRRIVEGAADRQRCDQEIREAGAKLAAAHAERMEIVRQRAGDGEAIEAAADAAEDARAGLAGADAEMAAAASALAGAQAARQAAVEAHAEGRRRAESLDRRLAESLARLDAARAAAAPTEALEEALARGTEADERVAACGEAAALAEAELAEGLAAEEAASATHDEMQGRLTRLSAEREGLRAVRVVTDAADPVSGRLRVEPGYEAAVAAALGEGALAGTDPGEAAWWHAPGPGALLWEGMTLADVAGGVPEVAAFLASVAVASDEAGLDRMAGALQPGSSVVTPSGSFLRWDGYRSREGGGTARAAFERANRLRELDAGVEAASAALEGTRAARAAARGACERLRAGEAAARAAARAAFEEARQAREALARLQRAAEEGARRLAVAEAEAGAAKAERGEAHARLGVLAEALGRLPDETSARRRSEEARARVDSLRKAESDARALVERITAEAAARRQRLDACLREEAAWTVRRDEASALREDLSYRVEAAEAALEEAEAAAERTPPDAVETAREAVAAAEADVNLARAAELEGEARRAGADDAVRNREAAASALREERARLQAGIEMARRARLAVEADAESLLACRADALLAASRHPEGTPLPDLQAAVARQNRLERERDALGMVNFLAEQELADQERQFGEMERRRAETREELAALARGLRQIEEEARAKLSEAYTLLDGHFGDLFSRLFDGGQAHLRLVDSEDILEAGLEIYASPPGKRMQILSLLSGGEQALTAMALVFAAFLANPAPICVCDEVDAALDDANTDRLVRLMETMAQGDETRFLCVTHSPLTMARMNRLYGVTMMERGVSTLTKVDLDRAIEIVDS